MAGDAIDRDFGLAAQAPTSDLKFLASGGVASHRVDALDNGVDSDGPALRAIKAAVCSGLANVSVASSSEAHPRRDILRWSLVSNIGVERLEGVILCFKVIVGRVKPVGYELNVTK